MKNWLWITFKNFKQYTLIKAKRGGMRVSYMVKVWTNGAVLPMSIK